MTFFVYLSASKFALFLYSNRLLSVCQYLTDTSLPRFLIFSSVPHLMTTSRNLFQSAGLNRESIIARPLISFIMRPLISSVSLHLLSESVTNSISKRHFSTRLQKSQSLPSFLRPSSYSYFKHFSCYPGLVAGSNISGQKKLHISLSSFSKDLRINRDGMIKKISASRYSRSSANYLCFSAVASITCEKCKS